MILCIVHFIRLATFPAFISVCISHFCGYFGANSMSEVMSLSTVFLGSSCVVLPFVTILFNQAVTVEWRRWFAGLLSGPDSFWLDLHEAIERRLIGPRL